MEKFEYSDLKKQIISIALREQHMEMFEEIKQRFRDNIDSPRRYEQIMDMKNLLQVLELRDELSESKVDPLKTIAQYFDEQLLKENIENYDPNTSSGEKSANLYIDTENVQPPMFSTFNHNPYMKTISENKRNRIVDTVVNEIGNSWRDLARYLGIQEGIIDIIDEKYRKNSLKVKDMLSRYEKYKADPQRWFFVLCQALEKCRRKDLSISLQEIMTMNL